MFTKIKQLTQLWLGISKNLTQPNKVASDERKLVEIRHIVEVTVERDKPNQFLSPKVFDAYRFTLRPSRLMPPHMHFLSSLSSGSTSVAIPEVLTAGETYESLDQTYGVFPNVLAYPYLGCVIPTPGIIIYETDRAAANWSRELINTPGMDWEGENRFFNFKTSIPQLTVNEPCLFTIHGSITAYGHWMSDCMSSVWLWRKELMAGDVKLLMPRYPEPWVSKMLDFFEIPASARIQAECELIRIKTAIVANSCKMGNVVRPPDVMREIGEHCVGMIGGNRNNLGNRRIYLQRGDNVNWSRPIENEAKVIELLSTLGFEIVNPADLDFLEQVQLFSEASIVVSAHGSALVNLIFAPIGCKVIDLMQQGWIKYENSYRWIYRLTSILEQSYVLILMDKAEDESNASEKRFASSSSIVNIVALTRAVKGCL
jgi:capsular polysaccharide biosynthesis protein